MSFVKFNEQISLIEDWLMNISFEKKIEIAEQVGGLYDICSSHDMKRSGTVEAMRDRLTHCEHYLSLIGAATLDGLRDGRDKPFPKDALEAAKTLLAGTLPVYDLLEDGLLVARAEGCDGPHVKRFTSLGQAAMNSDVQVAVFDRDIQAELVYEGTAALEVGYAGLKDLEPAGVRSIYKVAIMDGQIHHPPLWPADILQEQTEREVEALGNALEEPGF